MKAAMEKIGKISNTTFSNTVSCGIATSHVHISWNTSTANTCKIYKRRKIDNNFENNQELYPGTLSYNRLSNMRWDIKFMP